MNRKYALLLSLFFYGFALTAQIENAATSGNEPFCRVKDYAFRQAQNTFKDKEKAYVCPKYLPTEITVMQTDVTPPIPVQGQVSWTLNGQPLTDMDHTISVDTSSFMNSMALLTCSFNSADGSVSMELEIRNDIALTFKEKDKIYQYDDNNIIEYIEHYNGDTSQLGIPWNFMGSKAVERLKAEVTKKKGYYAVEEMTPSNNNLVINPNKLSNGKENITLSFSPASQSILAVSGCHHEDPELLIYTETPKEFYIEVFRVCDTDDDVQVIAQGEIAKSASDVCISGGQDRTIDEMYNPNFLQVDDTLVYDATEDRWFVWAGTNLICDTKANPSSSNPTCPTSFNIDNSIDHGNDVLKRVSLKMMLDTLAQLNVNYDLFEDDGIMDQDEINQFNILRLAQGHIPGVTPSEIYLIRDLGLNNQGLPIAGRAFGFGLDNLALDTQDAVKGTLLHELGHAKWELFHPSEQWNVVANDSLNFMYRTSTGRTDRIRRYQFDEMHEQ